MSEGKMLAAQCLSHPDLLDMVLSHVFSIEFEDCRLRWKDLQLIGSVSRAFVKPARKACLQRIYVSSLPSLKALCYRVLPLFGAVHVKYLSFNLVREAFRGRDRRGVLFQDLAPLLSQCTMLRYLHADPCWHVQELDHFPLEAFEAMRNLSHLSHLVLCDPCCLDFLQALPKSAVMSIPAPLKYLHLDVIPPDGNPDQYVLELMEAMARLPTACPTLQSLAIQANGSIMRPLIQLLSGFLSVAPSGFEKLTLATEDYAEQPYSLHFTSSSLHVARTVSFRYINSAKAFLQSPDANIFDACEVIPLTVQECDAYLNLLTSAWRHDMRAFTLYSDFAFNEFQLAKAEQAADLRGMTLVHDDPGVHLQELYWEY